MGTEIHILYKLLMLWWCTFDSLVFVLSLIDVTVGATFGLAGVVLGITFLQFYTVLNILIDFINGFIIYN